MWLHQLIHLFVRQVDIPMNKRLPHLVQGCIVEILGFEGGFIDHGIAWIAPVNDMLFYQLHELPPRFPGYSDFVVDVLKCPGNECFMKAALSNKAASGSCQSAKGCSSARSHHR